MDRLVCYVNIALFFTLLFHHGVPAPQNSFSLAASKARSLKKSLGINEDNYLTFQELTSKYAFPSEEHKVVTEDKYILTVFRIFPKCDGSTKRYPVLMAHGMFDSSDTWIISGPEDSLGYILASRCYDVWLTNRRGNTYSRQHTTLNPDTDDEYWNFSFDENGNYDLTAVIDHILNVTQKEKVNFIGHSQGTTDFFAMTSLKPEYNDKIALAVALAPIAWLKNLFNPFIKLAAPNTKNLKQVLDTLGWRELFGRYRMMHLALEVLCSLAPGYICGTSLYLATGSRNLISAKKLPIIFGHILDGVSSKGLAHFGQLIETNRFQRYDEGREGNMKRYGTPKPPAYNVSQIIAPIVLVGSKGDWLSSVNDVDHLSARLPHVLEKYIMPDSRWSHNDHLWADNAPRVLYPKIIEHFEKFNT